MMKSIRSYFISITALILILSWNTHSEAQGLTPDDVVSIESVGAVSMNSDGTYIAYTLSVPRTDDDSVGRNYSELYILSVSGGDPIAIVEKPESAGSPQWGPDNRLYFTSRFDEYHNQTQVYSVNTSGEDLQRHSSSDHGLSSYEWNNDGSVLAYSAMDPVSEELRSLQERGFDMIVAGENQRFMRLWVQPRDGEAERISHEGHYVWSYTWAPSGDRLAVRISDRPGADVDQMYTRYAVVNSDGSGLSELMSSPRKKSAMSWSPDGSKLAVLAGKVYSDPLPQRFWILNTDGTNNEDVTPDGWEGTPESIGWMDNETLWFTAVERSVTGLYTLRLGQLSARMLAGGDQHIFRNVSLDSRFNLFAASVNTADHPGEVYVADLRRGHFERLTHHNSWLNDRELGEQNSITWSGADDLEIEGIVTKPVGFQEGIRYPLIVLPHGGPEGTSMNGWNTRALYPTQVLANEGYVVFEPNYRGSGGRGTAFGSANHRDLGGKEFDDVLLGIDYLEETGWIDSQKVGISGTSYGGYFSAWAATRYSDRFAAGITFAGLSNWISFMGTTDISHEMSVVHWDLYWFDNPGQNWERSPVAWLNQADTPLLVAHGLADDRVHPEQSIQLHRFLEMLDIPTGLVLYPRQPHGLTERAHQLDFMNRVIDWFDT
ncbi:MAG: S9 family peptidase, partial [Balneolaceae bacterium]